MAHPPTHGCMLPEWHFQIKRESLLHFAAKGLFPEELLGGVMIFAKTRTYGSGGSGGRTREEEEVMWSR